MSLFDIVSEHINVVRSPLFAVGVTAISRPDTPLLLLLHWHGFQPQNQILQADISSSQSLPTSVLQLNTRWADFSHVEQDILDAAWQLGAWDVNREEKRGCNTIGASYREALECRQAFADFPVMDSPESALEEAPDRIDMMNFAARVGYVTWQFRPVHGGIWNGSAPMDGSLLDEGRRAPPCPVLPAACKGGRYVRTVFRLGVYKKELS